LLPFLSARQLLDWQHFAEQCGLGVNRDDIHWGMLCSMFYNVNRGSGTPTKTAEDFMPYLLRDDFEDESENDFRDRIRGLLASKLA
jgi:hypothetical protein